MYAGRGHLQFIHAAISSSEAAPPRVVNPCIDQFGTHPMVDQLGTQPMVDQFGSHRFANDARRIPSQAPAQIDRDQQPAFDMSSSSMIQTALGQQFRSGIVADTSVQESRAVILDTFRNTPVAVRQCPFCGIMLIGSHRRPFAENDGWCCGGETKTRQHRFWPPLPWEIDAYDFSGYARVINSLLSVAVIHGSRDEGLSYRRLSYQAPVMTVNGQLYARLMRDANRCWFVHDSDYEIRLLALLKSSEESNVLTLFTRVLQENN